MYPRFVKSFAKIAAPLNQKRGKTQTLEFEVLTDEEYEAFVELKKRLVSPPILALPRYGKKYTLDTDACAYLRVPGRLRHSTGAAERRLPTDRVFEPRPHGRGEELHNYQERMPCRRAEHSHASTIPLREYV